MRKRPSSDHSNFLTGLAASSKVVRLALSRCHSVSPPAPVAIASRLLSAAQAVRLVVSGSSGLAGSGCKSGRLNKLSPVLPAMAASCPSGETLRSDRVPAVCRVRTAVTLSWLLKPRLAGVGVGGMGVGVNSGVSVGVGVVVGVNVGVGVGVKVGVAVGVNVGVGVGVKVGVKVGVGV